jgi:hypothetical protein
MKAKRVLAVIIILLSAVVSAQEVSFIKVTDEAQYKQSGDFTNTFEIKIGAKNSSRVSKCQAVRIGKSWYITASHCLFPRCEEGCNITVRLVVTPNYEMDAHTEHSAKTPRVFNNEKVNLAKIKSAYDIALLHMPANKIEYSYIIPQRNRRITKEQFLKIIPNAGIYTKALNGTNLPSILYIDSSYPAVLDREISVVSIWDGNREVLPAQGPLYYMPMQKYIFAENFGIKEGNSGSGVMTNTGELVGIVSATSILTDKNKQVDTPLLFIASYDTYIKNFIDARTGGGITFKRADRTFLKNIPADKRALPNAFEKASFVK